MRHSPIRLIVALLLLLGPASCLLPSAAGAEFHYLVGRGKADITGPARGVTMWGFGRPDQLTEGIHFRQWARAFVIADPVSGGRLAFVSADIGSITHSIKLEVVEQLEQRYGTLYDHANVILSATHTHAGPGGYWHHGTDTPLGSTFHREHFDAIVAGIIDALTAAHEDLAPGDLFVARGEVTNGGAQRSAVAYLANPAEERARYSYDTDREMTLIRLIDASGPVGAINWFAVHPTAMTFDNRLISGDHKGHAAARFENLQPEGFVAAFAQTNCGDVTANLNLDNTGPAGDDDFENTRILAERQLEVALQLFESDGVRLEGPIETRHGYLDFSYQPVDEAFAGEPDHTTCPSAYGYAFGAGSTEDGGGHPLLSEGMLEYVEAIDALAKAQLGIEPPSQRLRDCHHPKPILIATGETQPYPAQAQVVPITVARIGQLALVAMPGEVTTMAGRRLRETVAVALGDEVDHVVIVGYANDYAGYVTTPEEYRTQQYEGGHTLYGPWTLDAYRQELTRLAADLTAGRETTPGAVPRDVRSETVDTPLGTSEMAPASDAAPGAVLEPPNDSYSAGQQVRVVFSSVDPRSDYRTGSNYLIVERQSNDQWIRITADHDWATQGRWKSSPESPDSISFEVLWNIPQDIEPGSYRIVHEGSYRLAGEAHGYQGESASFRVRARGD